MGLEVLGVVENMSGLEQRVSSLRFLAGGSSGEAGAAEPVDVTEAALAALSRIAPDLVACSDVFLPTKGGAQAMARDMGVPFLGRIPLDPALSLAGARPQGFFLLQWAPLLHQSKVTLASTSGLAPSVKLKVRRAALSGAVIWVELGPNLWVTCRRAGAVSV